MIAFVSCLIQAADPVKILPIEGDTLFDIKKAQCRALYNREEDVFYFTSQDSIPLLPNGYHKVGPFHYYSPHPEIPYLQEEVHIYNCWVSKMVDSVELFGVVQERQYVYEGNELSMITLEEWITPQFTSKVVLEEKWKP